MPDSPRRRRRRASVLLALLAPSALAAGCGGSSGPVTLTVLAASSLTEVFAEMGVAYHQANPDVRVRFEFGGSQEMAARLSEHDRGDVLVTADTASMDEAASHLSARRAIVTHNLMTIALVSGNPKGIRGLQDLTRPGLRIAVGAATVPVGRYARQVFARAGVTVRWTSEEISARAVLDQVRSGESDAGLVYITDLRSAGATASSVPIPAAQNVVASYPAAAVKGGDRTRAAEAFVTWLTGADAQRLFAKYGFPSPEATR
ncbi:molybdate ABC transporter substrate-binding protein [Actinomadura roseirufa]|uniref:molybdate ABC transporter substrate-binding protein n=1 Tax=Actinomadura roseirufa TaxID=2094049 RepID=UPI0010417C18|nr:molybdate ABC transporter substrate-binding protein [Actinomadura roseirufa]